MMVLVVILGGCTDSAAYNYDSSACFDDGTCIAVVEVVQIHRHLTIIHQQIRMMGRVSIYFWMYGFYSM